MKNFIPIIVLLIYLFLNASWYSPKVYTVDKNNYTFQKDSGKYYIDVDALNAIKDKNIHLKFSSDVDLFVEPDKTLFIKSNCLLTGSSDSSNIKLDAGRNSPFISIENSRKVEITGLYISAIATDKTLIENNIIEIENSQPGNSKVEIYGCKLVGGHAGIYLKRGRDITIHNNHTYQGQFGIRMGEVGEEKNVLVENVILKNNKIFQATKNGIDINAGCKNIIIKTDTLQQNLQDGIRIDLAGFEMNSPPAKSPAIVIEDCYILQNHNTGIEITQADLSENSYPLLIRNNTVIQNHVYGLLSSVPCHIEANIFSQNHVTPNAENPSTVYAGLYLLNISKGKECRIVQNIIQKQSPFPNPKAVVYMNLTNVTTPTTIKENILNGRLQMEGASVKDVFGIFISKPIPGVEKDSLLKQNTFTPYFNPKVIINN